MKFPWSARSEKQQHTTIRDAQSGIYDDIQPSDLPFTLYLNQRLVFDALASLEDGFSYLETVETRSTREESSGKAVKGELGASNAFALLGVSLGGQAYKHRSQAQDESTTTEKIHTPASLFARLRRDLRSRGLVREVLQPADLQTVRAGSFVEFEATLRRNPFVGLLSAFSELVPLMELADPSTDTAKGARGRKTGKGRDKAQEGATSIKKQIDIMLPAVTGEGSQDLIAEVSEMRVVLTTDETYFIDPSMNDTIDGTFHVFGKATRIIVDGTEAISLLRKTPLGKFENVVETFASAMAGIEGVAEPVVTEFRGPAMQVIPIAIFS